MGMFVYRFLRRLVWSILILALLGFGETFMESGATWIAELSVDTPHSIHSSFLWYRVRPGETITAIIGKLKLCDDPKVPSCLKSLLSSIERLNPIEVHSDGEMVFQYSQLVLPIRDLPAGLPFQITENREIVPFSSPPRTLQPSTVIAAASFAPSPVRDRTPAAISTPSDVPSPIPNFPAPVLEPHGSFSPPSTWANGDVTLMPVFSYSRISSTELSNGTSARLISGLNTGLNLRWEQKWSDFFQSFFEGGVFNSTYQDEGSSKTVTGTPQLLSHFSLGANLHPTDRLSIRGYVGASQELIATAQNLTSIQLDRNFYPKLGLDLDYRMIEFHHTSLSALMEGYLLLPQTADGYDVQLGNGYLLGTEIAQDLSRAWSIGGGVGFRSQSQNTGETKQNFTEIEFTMGIQFIY